jgi:CHAT domain-containing protein
VRIITYLPVIYILVIGATVAAADAPAELEAAAQAATLQGDFDTAAGQWLELSEIYGNQDDALGQSRALSRAAEAQQALGQNQTAIKLLEQALQAASAAGQDAWRATLQAALGAALLQAGSMPEAESQLQAALELARAGGARQVEAAALNNLGNLQQAQGRDADAMRNYTRSVELAAQDDKHALAARAADNAAELHLQQENHAAAREQLDVAARHARQLPNNHDKAYLLIRTAQLYRKLVANDDKLQQAAALQAHALLTEAADIAVALQDARAASYARGYLGGLYETAGRYDEGLLLTNKAIYSIQPLYAPEILYLWKWQAGRIYRALGDTDAAIAAYREAVASIQAVRAELDNGSEGVAASFRADAAPVFLELADLLLRASEDGSDTAQVQARLVEARETVELLKAAELQDYFQDDCVAAVREKIRGLDETLTTGTAVLYPIAFDDRIELLLSLPSGLQRITVDVGREALAQEVRTFRRYLEKRTTRQYMRQARQLYDWIIRPMEKQLEANHIQVLVLVPDATLRTVPLAALHDGKQFLVENYAIATTPSMRLTDPRPIDRGNVNLLLNGLSVRVDDFPALLYVDDELAAISKIYGGKQLTNESFRKARLEQELAGNDYSIVHLATHGKFAGKVRDSYVLTYDGRMSMDELEQFVGISWFRQDNPVELLTLSACETAVGDDSAALGLASVAIKAGARSALASLWSINDEASSKLVADFYRELQDPAITKAQALQRAQLGLLADLRYQHPVYWSPFLLIGNWL